MSAIVWAWLFDQALPSLWSYQLSTPHYRYFCFSKCPALHFSSGTQWVSWVKTETEFVNFCMPLVVLFPVIPTSRYHGKRWKKLLILALCNALGSWHYWNQALILASSCMGACSNIACGLGCYPLVHVKTIPKMMWIHEQSLNRHNIVWCQNEIREQGREFPLFSSTQKIVTWHKRVQSDSHRQSQNCVVGVYHRKSHQYHEQCVCPNSSNSESQTPVNKFRAPL